MKARPFARPAFFPHHLPNALQFLRHLLVGGDNRIESIGNFPGKSSPGPRQAHGKIPIRIVCRLARITLRSPEPAPQDERNSRFLFYDFPLVRPGSFDPDSFDPGSSESGSLRRRP